MGATQRPAGLKHESADNATASEWTHPLPYCEIQKELFLHERPESVGLHSCRRCTNAGPRARVTSNGGEVGANVRDRGQEHQSGRAQVTACRVHPAARYNLSHWLQVARQPKICRYARRMRPDHMPRPKGTTNLPLPQLPLVSYRPWAMGQLWHDTSMSTVSQDHKLRGSCAIHQTYTIAHRLDLTSPHCCPHSAPPPMAHLFIVRY